MKTPIFSVPRTYKNPRSENPKQFQKKRHSKELNTLISGSTAGGFDVKDLRENTVLSGGYQAALSSLGIMAWKHVITT